MAAGDPPINWPFWPGDYEFVPKRKTFEPPEPVRRVLDELANQPRCVPGRKDDGVTGNGPLKPRWSLIPWGPLREILKVLEHGAKKYDDWNWTKVENGEERYREALLRHMIDYAEGIERDHDSGLLTLAHIGCNALFLIWFKLQGEQK